MIARRKRTLLPAHCLLLAAVAACRLWAGVVIAGEGEKLLVGHLRVTGHAKLFVAKEMGFFADEGLDVELIAYGNSADGLAALRVGKLDVGAFGTVAPLVHVAAGADIRIIGGIMGEDAFLVARPEMAATIREPADLAGKRVATVRFSSGDAVMRGAIMAAGLTVPDDLTVIELSGPAATRRAVRAGLVDVGLVWGPHDQLAEAEGLRLVMATADLFPGHPCCRAVVTGEKFASLSSVWPRFLRAVLRAGKFVQDPVHRTETVGIIARYLNEDERVVERGLFGGRLDQTSDPYTDSVLRIWDIINASGLVHSDRDLAAFIEIGPYREALENLALAEPDESYWRDALTLFRSRNLATKGGGE